MWTVSVVTTLITAPVAFIAGIFATDSGTGAALTTGAFVMFSPLLFIVFAIIAHLLYRAKKFTAFKVAAALLMLLCLGSVGYLVQLMFFSA